MYEVFTNKDCMYFGALVGEYYFILYAFEVKATSVQTGIVHRSYKFEFSFRF
jgi:hypothetical protein